ncbi:MAG: hypothetical protein M1820_006842 [Bogoriella megaspora]|nr:MAG: hypothetical protein M1820_006842 [Bogoriella megaspora]
MSYSSMGICSQSPFSIVPIKVLGASVSSMSNKTLLDLPLELRTQIYDLIPATSSCPLSHPISTLALTSVSHRPPPVSLLLVCRAVTNDLLSHYYRSATFKIVLSHVFNFYRVDPNLSKFAAHPVLQYIENVELVFFCDGILLRDYPSFGPEQACREVGRRAERAVEVLSQAQNLKHVKISWIDPGGHWGGRSEAVRPVVALRQRGVTVSIGEILGIGGDEKEIVVHSLELELGIRKETMVASRPRDSVIEYSEQDKLPCSVDETVVDSLQSASKGTMISGSQTSAVL